MGRLRGFRPKANMEGPVGQSGELMGTLTNKRAILDRLLDALSLRKVQGSTFDLSRESVSLRNKSAALWGAPYYFDFGDFACGNVIGVEVGERLERGFDPSRDPLKSLASGSRSSREDSLTASFEVGAKSFSLQGPDSVLA